MSPTPANTTCVQIPQVCTITRSIPTGPPTVIDLSLLPDATAAGRSDDIFASVDSKGMTPAPAALNCSGPQPCAVKNTDIVKNGIALVIGLSGPVPGLGVGEPSKYEVTVTNNGTADAATQNFRFSLPDSMDFNSVDGGDGWSCPPDGARIWSCTRSVPLPGRSPPIKATLNVTPNATAAASTVTMHVGIDPTGANVTGSLEPCSGNLNCVSSDPAPVASNVALKVDLDLNGNAFSVGTVSNVTLTVHNSGSVDKNDVPVRISLPDGLAFDSPPTNLNCATRSVRSYDCTFIPTAKARDKVTSILSLLPESKLSGESENIYALIEHDGNELPADVDGTCAPSDTCNIKKVGPIGNGVQLAAVLSEPDVPLGINAISTYKLSLTNNGTGDARARFKLWLPEALDLSATRIGGDWTCTGTSSPFICSSPTPLKPKVDTAVANIAVTPNRVASNVVIEAGVSQQGSDSLIDSASSCGELSCTRSTQVAIASNVELSVTVSKPSPALNVGAISEYIFVVHNSGIAPTSTAKLRIAVPEGLSTTAAVAKARGDGWTCTEGAAIACDFSGSMAASVGKSEVVLTVITDPIQAGKDAVVWGSVDPTGGSAARDPVDCRLALQCTTDATLAGDIVATVVLRPSWVEPLPALKVNTKSTYQLKVANAGAIPASSATVHVRFANGAAYDSFEGNGWTCLPDSGDSQLLKCNRSTPLDARSESTLSFNVNVGEDIARSDVVQYASVDVEGGANPVDPAAPCSESHGCVATAPAKVDSGIDLSFKFEGPTPELRVGTQSTYRLIMNNAGTAAATGAKVLLLIPNGMEFVSHASDNWACTHEDELLTCVFTQEAKARYLAQPDSRTIGLRGDEIIEFTVVPQLAFGGTSYVQHVAVALPNAAAGESIPGPGCFPESLCSRSPANPITSTNDTLLLIKTVGSRKVEIGDLVTYTLSVKNPGAGVATAVSIQDRMPAGFRLEKRTTQILVSQSGAITSSEPVVSASGVRFDVGNLAGGATAEVSYRMRVGIGAKIGTAINRARAVSTNGLSSSDASVGVEVTAGVFGDDGCIAGKVFVDSNGDGVQTTGEPTVAGAKLYLQNGMHFTTDWAGRYSFCGVKSRSNVIKLDKRSIPAGCSLKVLSNSNMGDGGSIFLGASNGHLQRGDFALGNCSAAGMQEIEKRNAAAFQRRGK